MIRLALNHRFKLYEDGRLFDLNRDFYESTPLLVAGDNSERSSARKMLQDVLDSMKPYPRFDPTTVPRPDPNAAFARCQFQDQGGLVIVEAEQLPIPRDESWRVENSLPEYTGTGYLRLLRDQRDEPSDGLTQVYLSIDAADTWNVAIRCRTDHPIPGHENSVWIRANDGPWRVAKLAEQTKPGTWAWIESTEQSNEKTSSQQTEPLTFQFNERGNRLWIAPRSQNLKIDRIVAYQADQKTRALNVATPSSAFHPWARP